MARNPDIRPLGEEDLARLLSASTGEEERKLLLARLAADANARELLRMAAEALEAVGAGAKDRRAA